MNFLIGLFAGIGIVSALKAMAHRCGLFGC